MTITRRHLVSALMLTIGVVHLAPGLVGLSTSGLRALYGAAVSDDPTLLTMLRHRSVLLALVGAGLVAAVRRPGWCAPALVAAGTSMVSFVALHLLYRSPELTTVAVVDGVALAALVVVYRHRDLLTPAGRTARDVEVS
ncbi:MULTISPECIES: phosphopantetheine adenylyltransferase [Pseudonocardia]|uniref:Phosphopantetheine adenylyltransferase n=2 Tax=Pseudonocardia TaxID=1847 RepID=A0A1Y2MNX0_PSEAH|nr:MULTISPECIES: phosphopantetheine adenylyltransferase [Pseudonocardia]OSY36940.1 hypothetical protein BG845_05023 [Pseudonocardia autotrophica]TDN75623.1 hypothetical protein C8E95_4801 [Pseudonocardia autotrophica]BBF99594.1 hypothetical protein Pdca_08040 [Pseudonocardia autotrophica]GEC28613.1 hypothetical protein PSA01_56420 [Pseudonocardia saturnea]